MSSARYASIIKRTIPDVEFHQNTYARELTRIVGNGVRWLDIGAGSRLHDGYGVSTPLELSRCCDELVGIDFEEKHLAANEALTSYVVGGAESMPFSDERFNLVTANMVLEHLEHPKTVFGEISRVLSSGGRFIFVTPNLNHPIIRTCSILLRPQTQRSVTNKLEGREMAHIFPTFYRANTISDIKSIAIHAGLEIESLAVVRNIPFVTSPAFAVWLECQAIKLTKYRPLQGFGADILGVLRKP